MSTRVPLKLTNEQQRALKDDPQAIADEIREQVSGAIRIQTVGRLLGSIEMRIDEPLELSPSAIYMESWGNLEIPGQRSRHGCLGPAQGTLTRPFRLNCKRSGQYSLPGSRPTTPIKYYMGFYSNCLKGRGRRSTVALTGGWSSARTA